MQQTSELGISLRPGFDIAVVCAVQLCTIGFSRRIFPQKIWVKTNSNHAANITWWVY